MITPTMILMMPKEVLYIFTNVIELYGDNITALKGCGGLWNYKNIHATAMDFLKRLFRLEHITFGAFQYLSDWKMYVHNKPYTTYTDIMLMIYNIW